MTDRMHGLDNLRAVMMWLGVVIHVAALHCVEPGGLEWRDPQTHPVADLIGLLIHAFRMPVFFVVAGFFMAALAHRRGPMGMLRHRALRVGLPFVVFWLPVFASVVVVSTLLAQPAGQLPALGFDLQSVPATPSGARLQTVHLWFLELLMGFAVVAAVFYGLVPKVPASWRVATAGACRTMVTRAGGLAAASVFLAIVSRHHPDGIIGVSGEVLPPLSEWLYYAPFCGFGVVLHQHRDELLESYKRRVWLNACGGAVFFLAALVLSGLSRTMADGLPYARVLVGLTYGACSWLWCLALIGGFLRYLPRRSTLLAYLAATSYWVYLVHLPVLGCVELLMREWQVAFVYKMMVNVFLTSLICLATYELLVRRTWIGRLLNGNPKRTEVPRTVVVSPGG